MRHYTSDHISKLLQDKYSEWDLISMIERHNMLKEVWKSVSDPRLESMKLDFSFPDDRVLVIHCSSSLTLNYVRRQRSLIEDHLNSYMSKYGIERIEILLADR